VEEQEQHVGRKNALSLNKVTKSFISIAYTREIILQYAVLQNFCKMFERNKKSFTPWNWIPVLRCINDKEIVSLNYFK